jgi:threonine synthase
MVTDHQIKEAYKMLAALEGVFAEPASAASVAGLIKLAENGYFDKVDAYHGDKLRIVCILTGHGLKDPDNAIKAAEEPITVDAEESAVLDAIGLEQEVMAGV